MRGYMFNLSFYFNKQGGKKLMRKFISKALVFMLSLILILSCLPLSSLVAYADNSSGTGGAGGNTVAKGYAAIWHNNSGVRLYLVDASKGPENLEVVPFTFKGKKYDLLDIWDPAYGMMSSLNVNFKAVYEYGVRVGSKSQSLSALTMTYNTLTSAGLSSPKYVNDGTTWSVSGSTFHSWMTSKSPKKNNTNMSLIMYSFMADGNKDNYQKLTKSYYLIAEPLVCMPAYADNSYDGSGYRGTVIGTWYDYMRFNEGSNGGWSAAKARSFANGFKLGVEGNNADYKKFVNKTIKDNLGLNTPAENAYFGGPSPWHTYDYFKYVGNDGWGIQVYWDGDTPPTAASDPIDTYNIDKKTTLTPDNAEVPSDKNNNKGSKTIVKMYVDLYKDEKTGYYTEIVDTATYARKNVSNLVSITDERNINGYNVAAWYTSNIEYTSDKQPDAIGIKASDMIAQIPKGGTETDGTVSLSVLGGKQIQIGNYNALTEFPLSSKKYFTALSGKHGKSAEFKKDQIKGYTNPNTNQYTNYKRKDISGKTVYGPYNYPQNTKDGYTVVDIGDDETIVILYTRERTKLSTGDYNDPGETTITTDTNKHNDKSGNLKIVKLYGVLNPSTYEITNDPSKSKVVISNATRNVNINSESGYDLAEWIYLTGGAGTGISASDMGDPSHYSFDGSADKAYRLDGFVDGFKNNSSYSRAFKFRTNTGSLEMPTIYTLSNPDGIAETTVPGRYSIGSRSGIGSKSYNSTIYFGGDGKLADDVSDSSDKNDVLYMLFLKVDQLSYETDDLVIPQSYVTRYDNYKHNAMKVTGSVSGTTYNEYLQNHKFKYLLPVISNKEYQEVNPLFIGQISIDGDNKLQKGLLPNYSNVQRLEAKDADGKHEIIKGYVSATTGEYNYNFSDYVQMLYIDHNQAITSSHDSKPIGNILNLSAVNLEYTAYRSGDPVTAALWKYNSLISASGGNKRIATDTGALLENFTTGHIAGLSSAIKQTNFNTPITTRQANDSEQNFKLNFNFSEVGNGIKNAWVRSNKLPEINENTKLYNVDQPRYIMATEKGVTKNFELFTGTVGTEINAYYKFISSKYSDGKRVLRQAICAELPGDFKKYSINSLNRLYKIKVNGNWKYAVGTTQYLNAASDISITQNVKYGVHYGSAIANPYKDDTKSGNSTDKSRQTGYVKSMKATNTISFYPYYVMQYELPSTYNAQLNKNGTKNNTSGAMNNANQLYVIGEEKRYLNVYNYAEVSFSGHTVASSKGTDVVNNVVNSNRSGRIEISSEQWSTHARANSLIGLDNCALPGGATLSITIPNANRQTVTITSYGAFLPEQSAGYAQVKAMNDASAFGTMPTNTDAIKSRHNSLVGSVVAGFEGLNVEQYFTDTKGYTNTKDHGSTYDSANTVYNQISGELGSGKNLYDLPESKRYSVTDFTGKEDKYYYRPDGDVQIDKDGKTSTIKLSGFGDIELATGNNNDGKGNTGDFDTNYNDLDPNSPTSVTYYTFYMNRVGQVLCIADNNLNSSSKANLTGTTSGDGAVLVAEWSPSAEQHFTYASGLSNDVKQAAINTGIVEELYKQLQEGTGSDQFTPWGTSDGKWYFEAFDGITIAKYTTTLKVGFIDPYERTSVLDPAVVPSMQNKGDMLTSSVVSQIVTSDTSLKYGTVNKIGEFSDENGNKLGDIIMPDLRSFFISDLFFAPNITVQDLK